MTSDGGASARLAAKNAAMATGGVINDIMPKYRINMCAANAGMPTSGRSESNKRLGESELQADGEELAGAGPPLLTGPGACPCKHRV